MTDLTDKTGKPMDEQIKELWEWCGQERRNLSEYGRLPDWGYPAIDLNNLFRWAVPKAQLKGEIISLIAFEHSGFECCIVYFGEPEPRIEVRNEDPALALFWAIWKVIKSEH